MRIASSAITPNLAVVRLLQGFGGKSVPLSFVASELGLDDKSVLRHVQELADKDVVKLDGDRVSIA